MFSGDRDFDFGGEGGPGKRFCAVDVLLRKTPYSHAATEWQDIFAEA
jgi:hypothetical protein